MILLVIKRANIFTADREPRPLWHEKDKIKKVNDKSNKI